MRTETVLREDGMTALVDHLGLMDAERFVNLMLREPFDYTEWRARHLDTHTDVRELSRAASEYAQSLNEA